MNTRQELTDHETLINRIASVAHRALDPAEVFLTAVTELGSYLKADRCTLYMRDHAAGLLRPVAEYTAPGITVAAHEQDLSSIAPLIEMTRQRGVVAFDDVASDERIRRFYQTAPLQAFGTRSVMFAAVIVGDEAPGAFAISTSRASRRWSEADRGLARAVANETGHIVHRTELFGVILRAKRTWEATFDAMSDGIFIFDTNGKLARVNRAGAAMENATPQTLLARRVGCEIMHSDDGTCVIESAAADVCTVMREFTPHRLQRTLLVKAEPLRDNDEPSGVVCTVRDVSELREVEAVARARQSVINGILGSVAESIYAFDPDGRILWCNNALPAASGYRPEDLIGRHFLEATHEADHRMVSDRFARALNGERQIYEARYLTSDGSVRYAMVDNAPLVIDGVTTGVLGIARDITEQKYESERAAQSDKLRALGQLASGVAHDFNNALTAILGRVRLLQRSSFDTEVETSLDIIRTAAEDAGATVRRINTFTQRTDAEAFETLDVSALLRDATEMTRTRWEHDAHAHGLRYEVQLDAGHEILTDGCASELREVFVNLIVNALDAMPCGGRLSIKATRARGGLRLLFTDTGMGITPEALERIFEPFFTTKGVKGTGLGLFISYGIIERHAGQLTAQSEPGRGATFIVAIPAHGDSSEIGEGLDEETVARPLSVLVVDDEPFVRDTLVEMILSLNHDVTPADGGRAALAALAAQKYDLVFTDLSMPEMDGWTLARSIRSRWPDVCVVIVTGYGKDTPFPPGEENPADGVIGKPFDFTQVEETIMRLTGR